MSRPTIHRGYLSLAIALVVIAASGGYLAWRTWGPLGDPAAATPWELWRWLSERRLSDEPLPTRLALVGRLEEELRGGLELPADATLADLGPFRENCRLLESDWFYDRCQKWSQLAADDASRYMKAQLDLLSKWLKAMPEKGTAPEKEGTPEKKVTASRATVTDAISTSTSPPPETLSQKIERWLKEAPDSQRDTSLEAVRAGLFQWLCSTDLARVEPAARLDLANRISAELDSKRDLSGRLGKLSAAERAQLRANGWLLAQAWWTGQARRFVAEPTAQRDQFAARLVNRLENWDLSALRGPDDNKEEGESAVKGAPLEQLISELERWTASADPADAAPIRQLSARVGKVLAVRALKRLWGG